MKTIFHISLLGLISLSACTESAYQVTSQSVQEKMAVVDKTDYDKIEDNHKEKTEDRRQEEYHKYANDADKKLNHNKNAQLNQKKGWDGSFGFY